MIVQAIFGLCILMNFVASGVVTAYFLWPWLKSLERKDAIGLLVIPHAFRFIGLTFLVPGVVSPELPRAFAAPAAYGDLVAAVLAIVALVAIAKRASWMIPAVWIFNVWGTADFLFAYYQGAIGVQIKLTMLGAAFFIPTALVPPLLITHALIFRLLVRPQTS